MTTRAPGPKQKPGRKTAKKAATKKPAARADLNASASGWFAKQPKAVKPLVAKLRTIIKATLPGAEESLKWGTPVYGQGKLVCSISAHKDYASLIFFNGKDLEDPGGLLVGSGKQMRSVKIHKAADLKPAVFKKWLQEAAR